MHSTAKRMRSFNTMNSPADGTRVSQIITAVVCPSLIPCRGLQGMPIVLPEMNLLLRVQRTETRLTAAELTNPFRVTVHGDQVYFSEALAGNRIRVLDTATGQVTTLAGIQNSPGLLDGPGSSAQFERPAGLATDGTTLYIADTTTTPSEPST